jgi:uncharacterized membrane protein
MAKLSRSIHIKAPVEKVYNFLIEPNSLPEVWPSMVEVSNVQREPGGLHKFSWKYKMAGIIFDGKTEVVKVVPNQRVISESTGGISSKFDWTYHAEDNETTLKVVVEYTIPIPVLGKFAEAIVVKLNEREADTLLANIKDRMEA